MPMAFTPGSDNFSGINVHEPPHEDSLYVSNTFHQAVIRVDEKGAEAAAATEVTARSLCMVDRSKPVAVFRADRPFFFAICDKISGEMREDFQLVPTGNVVNGFAEYAAKTPAIRKAAGRDRTQFNAEFREFIGPQ